MESGHVSQIDLDAQTPRTRGPVEGCVEETPRVFESLPAQIGSGFILRRFLGQHPLAQVAKDSRSSKVLGQLGRERLPSLLRK